MSHTAPESLAEAILDGDRRALAQAITLLESSREDHRQLAEALLTQVLPEKRDSLRVGISGVPGAGKSTFIEALGQLAIAKGHRLAVLTIDPTSSVTGGSILGDKTRMPALARDPNAFIRPSPSGESAGGVGRRTREAVSLCEAAGFDLVLVETVGVGQSEIRVAGMTDLFLLLLVPGGGDELQGIKRGVMEWVDIVLVNKADGDLAQAADRAVAEYQHALGLMTPRTRCWEVPVLKCSALHGNGIEGVWSTIIRFRNHVQDTGEYHERRILQDKAGLWQEATDGIAQMIRHSGDLAILLEELEAAVAERRLPVSVAARRLIHGFLTTRGKTLK